MFSLNSRNFTCTCRLIKIEFLNYTYFKYRHWWHDRSRFRAPRLPVCMYMEENSSAVMMAGVAPEVFKSHKFINLKELSFPF